MIFPDGGRIVIIDDKEEEGVPLFKTLIKEGHLATFFTEWMENLPKNPLNGIRVVFLDRFLEMSIRVTKLLFLQFEM